MEANKLKQKIRQTLTQNPDKKITPAELEDVMIDMVNNQPSQESIIKKELFFDDGSGEVVPVKHPDLSTQPSILPYKFAGNYVYEQMVFVTSEQSNNDLVTLIKFSDFGLKNGKKILLDYNICQMRNEGGFISICSSDVLPFHIIAKNDKIVLVRVSGTETSDMWIRVVWTSEPNAGGYYGGYEYTQEDDYIRFLNNLQYAFGVKYNYSHYVSETEIHAGYELVLDGELLDDFKNNKMFITLAYKDSGAPEYVIITNGLSGHRWYIGQPLFYSAGGGGGLVLTELFGNVERCLIAMKKE